MKVNWQEYFREFCREHGQRPILWRADPNTKKGGWFLFPDGWLYGRIPSGPEIRPPNPKAQLYLILEYWTLRKKILREEIRLREDEIRGLAQLQSERSGRVIVSHVVREEDNGQVSREMRHEPIDFSLLLAKIKDLKEMLDECEDKLKNPHTSVTSVGVDFNRSEIIAELEEILAGGVKRNSQTP